MTSQEPAVQPPEQQDAAADSKAAGAGDMVEFNGKLMTRQQAKKEEKRLAKLAKFEAKQQKQADSKDSKDAAKESGAKGKKTKATPIANAADSEPVEEDQTPAGQKKGK